MSLVPIATMAEEGQKGAAIAYDYGSATCSLFPPAPSREALERYILEHAQKPERASADTGQAEEAPVAGTLGGAARVVAATRVIARLPAVRRQGKDTSCRRWRYRQPMAARVVLAFAVLTIATGCWPAWGGRAAELREGARSLVPSGTRVVEEVEADCVELARSPSCVHIYYFADQPFDERLRTLEEGATSRGWQTVSREVFAGGAQLRLRRNSLKASVFVLSDEGAARCRDVPSRECADVVMVER